MKKGGKWYSRGNSKAGVGAEEEGGLGGGWRAVVLVVGVDVVVVVVVLEIEGEDVGPLLLLRPGVGVDVGDCISRCLLSGRTYWE